MEESLKLSVMGFTVSFMFLTPVFVLKPFPAILLVLVYLGLGLSDFIWQSPELNENIANKILIIYKIIEIVIALSCLFVYPTNFLKIVGLFVSAVYSIIQLRLLTDAMELRHMKILKTVLDELIDNLKFCSRTYNRMLELKELVDVQLLIDFVQEFKAEQIESLLLTQNLSVVEKYIKTKQFNALRNML